MLLKDRLTVEVKHKFQQDEAQVQLTRQDQGDVAASWVGRQIRGRCIGSLRRDGQGDFGLPIRTWRLGGALSG